MPSVNVNGVSLHYEVTGVGTPIVFSHEFAGDSRSWKPQVEAFAGEYQCVTWNYRGYPPSDVPQDPDSYSQEIVLSDLLALMDYLNIERAHMIGLSMGGSVTLNFALEHPERCLSAVVAGAGSGTGNREQFEKDVAGIVELLTTRSMAEFADIYSLAPTRLRFKEKDPEEWDLFRRELAEHSAIGSANTMSRVQLKRPTIYSLEDRLRRMDVPTLLVIGDEDEPCIDPAVFMKRAIPTSGLVVFPRSGHTINLEEPYLFNQAVNGFIRSVEEGTWSRRETVRNSMLPASVDPTENG